MPNPCERCDLPNLAQNFNTPPQGDHLPGASQVQETILNLIQQTPLPSSPNKQHCMDCPDPSVGSLIAKATISSRS